MRLALVVLVACSCGSITPVTSLDVSAGDAAADAGAGRGEVHLEAAAGDAGGDQLRACGANIVGAQAQQCSDRPDAAWSFCFTGCRAQDGGAALVGCVLNANTICVASCADCF